MSQMHHEVSQALWNLRIAHQNDCVTADGLHSTSIIIDNSNVGPTAPGRPAIPSFLMSSKAASQLAADPAFFMLSPFYGRDSSPGVCHVAISRHVAVPGMPSMHSIMCANAYSIL